MACSKRPAKAPHLSCILDDWFAPSKSFSSALQALFGREKGVVLQAFSRLAKPQATNSKSFSELLREVRTQPLKRSWLGRARSTRLANWMGLVFCHQITLLLTGRVGMLLDSPSGLSYDFPQLDHGSWFPTKAAHVLICEWVSSRATYLSRKACFLPLVLHITRALSPTLCMQSCFVARYPDACFLGTACVVSFGNCLSSLLLFELFVERELVTGSTPIPSDGF